MLVAATWGTGQVLLDVVWFFLLLIEIWLMISIFIDIFRRHDMKGWLKALWIVVVIIAPLIGIVLYLILHGNEMRVHAQQAVDQQDEALRRHERLTHGHYSPSEELARLADLRDRGIINDEEFARLKERVIRS